MKRKIPALILCIALILLTFTACGSDGSGAKIVTPVDLEPEFLDPQIVSDTSAKNIVLNCFEGLVVYGENGEIMPAAAESFDVSADELTYTFNLRKNLQWRITSAAKKTLGEKAEDFDNRVLAKDFVFALERALSPETLCPYANSLLCIKNASKVISGKLEKEQLGVKAADDFTLVIKLEKKDSDFLDALTSPACMPCNEEFFNLTKGRYGLSTEYLIYNGPFYISNWAEKTSISCRRNDTYHSLGENISSEVKPYSIYFSFNNEQETRDDKLKDKTYALAPLSEEQAMQFSQDKHIKIRAFDSAVTSIIFNCSDEITSVSEIRKALAYGMDASVFLEKFGKKAAYGIIPSAATLAKSSYRSQVQNVKINSQKNRQAISFMKDGMDKLNVNDIELTILSSTENETAVRGAMQSWQSVFGVKFGISVEAVSEGELQSRIAAGNYQIALCDLKFTDVTAENAISRFESGARNNVINFSSKKFDNLISQISKSNGSKKAQTILEAEKYLISSCAVIPLCEKATYYGLAKGVSGIAFSPTGEVAYYKTAIQS